MPTTKPFEVDVSSDRGAPMGRYHTRIPAGTKCFLQRVHLVDGDYDRGGAYWGGYPALPLFCAWADLEDGQVVTYVRAHDREDAKLQLSKLGVEFFR